MKSGLRLFLLINIFLLSACSPRTAAKGETPFPTVTAPTPVEVVPSPTEGVAPTAPAPDTCETNPDHSLTLSGSDVEEWSGQLTQFILDEGDPSRIDLNPLASSELDFETNSIDDIDLNGDLISDLILTTAYGWSTGQERSGSLMVFFCASGRFNLGYSQLSNDEWGAPTIVYAGDMNADDLGDILVTQEHCGAHTCSLEARFLTWTGSSLEDRFFGSISELPFPMVEIEGPTEEGRIYTRFTGRGYGSAGAGPYRERSQLYSWSENELAYTLASDTLAAPVFRIHALHDADAFLLSGDISSAMGGYTQVIEDDALSEWSGGEAERVSLQAFASFRMVLLHLVDGDFENGRETYERMQAQFESQPSGAPYVQLAGITLEVFDQSNNLSDACQIIQNYALDHESEILTPLYFGYANPVYTPQDICPF